MEKYYNWKYWNIAYDVFNISYFKLILDYSYGSFGFKNIFNYASIPLFILVINLYTF